MKKRPIIALTEFRSIAPEQTLTQEEAIQIAIDIHGQSSDRLIRRYSVKPTQIASRRFESVELATGNFNIEDKAKFFKTRATQVAYQMYEAEAKAPDHLIHVTCTGYTSPSPAQTLVSEKGWLGKTGVTHAYHMGCYAAIPAVRIAEGFLAAGAGRADILHNEMCGLHMNRNDHSPEQCVVQSLFADGHIRYSAVPAETAKSGFEVLKTLEWILPESQSDMSWIPAPWGMSMTLSREVPAKIAGSLRKFMDALILDTDYDLATILKKAVFAVHPGGPKIIDSVQSNLELSTDQVSASKKILFDFGNMSSATLPHVWQKLLADSIPSGTPVVSLAFGPGLTIFGAVFKVI